MTRGSRVVVLADPLRGFGVIDSFERDGRPLVRFEASDSVAEWEPPDLLEPFDPHELEDADRWEMEIVPGFSDEEIAALLSKEGRP